MRSATVTTLLALTLTIGLMVAPSLTVSAETQSFLSVQGTRIVDADNQPILLRGVNYAGYGCGGGWRSEWSYSEFARLGLNVVRLPISWERLEPTPGAINWWYMLDSVNRDVQFAKKYGLYIVLDMHQFNWAKKFGGCGAPGWTVQDYPPTEAGMRQAISNFWADSNLHDHLVKVWKEIARTYANEPTIVGYDILNEPWVYTSVIPDLNATHVDEFYLKVIKAIREVDPNHIIFLEPANMHSHSFPLKENIVWSPHFYPLSFESRYFPENVTVLEADLAAKYRKFVVEMGSPMWIGEFGAFMKYWSSQEWLRDAIQLFNKY